MIATSAVAPSAEVRETPMERPAAAAKRIESTVGIPDWHAVIAALSLGGMARELAQHCELRGLDAGLVSLRLAPVHRHLQMKPAMDKLQQALSQHLGRAVQLRIELAETESQTPAATAQRVREEKAGKCGRSNRTGRLCARRH